MIDKKVYSEFQKMGFVVNDFMKQDLIEMHVMLTSVGATIRDANIMLILAIRDAASNGGTTSLSIRRTVELWSVLGFKNGDEVKAYVDKRDQQPEEIETKTIDIPWDIDIRNIDWSQYQ